MYTHIHVRKEKMALNRTVIIASQIAQVCSDIELCVRSLTVRKICTVTVTVFEQINEPHICFSVTVSSFYMVKSHGILLH